MPLRLILLRHAKTEKGGPETRDRDRKLTPRGRQDASATGAYMAHHDLLPEGAIVSTARRARETWEQAAAALASPPAARFEDRLYNASPEAILGLLREMRAPARSLLLVGHNPGLHEAACQLVASGDVEARERLQEKLPPAGLVVIDFAVESWADVHPQGGRLERFVTRSSLETSTD